MRNRDPYTLRLVYDTRKVVSDKSKVRQLSSRAFGVEVEAVASGGNGAFRELSHLLERALSEAVLVPGYTKATTKAWKLVTDNSIGTS